MTQTERVARRASRSRSTRAPRVTRDYAYFLENRLRERYRLEGIPLIIDFVERGEQADAEPARRAQSRTGRVIRP